MDYDLGNDPINEIRIIAKHDHLQIDKQIQKHLLSKLFVFCFLTQLYEFLRANNVCFLKGSFVLEYDNNAHPLYMYLMNGRDANVPLGLRSHKAFFDSSVASGIYEIHFNKNFKQLKVYCNSNPKFYMMENVKYYNFTANGKNFFYLKLERFPSLNLSHALALLDRKKQHRQNVRREKTIISKPPNDDDVKPKNRREDCDTLCKCKKLNVTANHLQPACYGDPLTYTYDNNTKLVYSQNRHKRSGDEFFVPLEIVNDLFEKINQNITRASLAFRGFYV